MALPSALMGKPQTFAPKVSGKIRPGIMVLTKKAQENPAAVALYNEGVASGLSFEEIKASLDKKLGGQGFLRPINTPYFTVRRQDFSMPEIADHILRLYGETREDGIRRLYRFPVVFATDEVTKILDFRFQMFTQSGLKFWSDESENGNQRLCKTYASVRFDNHAKRAVKLAGGRPVVLRAENRGICEPERCTEFQSSQCKMRGRILFYVPGIAGAGFIEIPTGSKNFGFDSERTLQQVHQATGGVLRGLAGDKPVFWITKRLHRNLPMIDSEGKPARTDQWLVEIEADLDMSQMVANPARQLTAKAEAAVAVLQGPAPRPAEAAATTDAVAEHPPVVEGHAEPSRQGAPQVIPGNAPPARVPGGDPADEAPDPATVQEVKRMRRKVMSNLEQIGIDPEQFAAYANKRWGDGWSRKLELLESVSQEQVEAFGDPASYKARVTTEIPF